MVEIFFYLQIFINYKYLLENINLERERERERERESNGSQLRSVKFVTNNIKYNKNFN